MKLEPMLLVVFATGCAHTASSPFVKREIDPSLRARFSKDLACPLEKISTVPCDSIVAATGCGREAVYVKEEGVWALDGGVVTLGPQGHPRSLMTRPEQIFGRYPRYTPEALLWRVQGHAVVKCVITVEGALTNCKIIKPLPYMDREILSALSTWRFKPSTFCGEPINVDYVFNINLVLPGSRTEASGAQNP